MSQNPHSANPNQHEEPTQNPRRSRRSPVNPRLPISASTTQPQQPNQQPMLDFTSLRFGNNVKSQIYRHIPPRSSQQSHQNQFPVSTNPTNHVPNNLTTTTPLQSMQIPPQSLRKRSKQPHLIPPTATNQPNTTPFNQFGQKALQNHRDSDSEEEFQSQVYNQSVNNSNTLLQPHHQTQFRPTGPLPNQIHKLATNFHQTHHQYIPPGSSRRNQDTNNNHQQNNNLQYVQNDQLNSTHQNSNKDSHQLQSSHQPQQVRSASRLRQKLFDQNLSTIPPKLHTSQQIPFQHSPQRHNSSAQYLQSNQTSAQISKQQGSNFNSHQTRPRQQSSITSTLQSSINLSHITPTPTATFPPSINRSNQNQQSQTNFPQNQNQIQNQHQQNERNPHSTHHSLRSASKQSPYVPKFQQQSIDSHLGHLTPQISSSINKSTKQGTNFQKNTHPPRSIPKSTLRGTNQPHQQDTQQPHPNKQPLLSATNSSFHNNLSHQMNTNTYISPHTTPSIHNKYQNISKNIQSIHLQDHPGHEKNKNFTHEESDDIYIDSDEDDEIELKFDDDYDEAVDEDEENVSTDFSQSVSSTDNDNRMYRDNIVSMQKNSNMDTKKPQQNDQTKMKYSFVDKSMNDDARTTLRRSANTSDNTDTSDIDSDSDSNYFSHDDSDEADSLRTQYLLFEEDNSLSDENSQTSDKNSQNSTDNDNDHSTTQDHDGPTTDMPFSYARQSNRLSSRVTSLNTSKLNSQSNHSKHSKHLKLKNTYNPTLHSVHSQHSTHGQSLQNNTKNENNQKNATKHKNSQNFNDSVGDDTVNHSTTEYSGFSDFSSLRHLHNLDNTDTDPYLTSTQYESDITDSYHNNSQRSRRNIGQDTDLQPGKIKRTRFNPYATYNSVSHSRQSRSLHHIEEDNGHNNTELDLQRQRALEMDDYTALPIDDDFDDVLDKDDAEPDFDDGFDQMHDDEYNGDIFDEYGEGEDVFHYLDSNEEEQEDVEFETGFDDQRTSPLHYTTTMINDASDLHLPKLAEQYSSQVFQQNRNNLSQTAPKSPKSPKSPKLQNTSKVTQNDKSPHSPYTTKLAAKSDLKCGTLGRTNSYNQDKKLVKSQSVKQNDTFNQNIAKAVRFEENDHGTDTSDSNDTGIYDDSISELTSDRGSDDYDQNEEAASSDQNEANFALDSFSTDTETDSAYTSQPSSQHSSQNGLSSQERYRETTHTKQSFPFSRRFQSVDATMSSSQGSTSQSSRQSSQGMIAKEVNHPRVSRTPTKKNQSSRHFETPISTRLVTNDINTIATMEEKEQDDFLERVQGFGRFDHRGSEEKDEPGSQDILDDYGLNSDEDSIDSQLEDESNFDSEHTDGFEGDLKEFDDYGQFLTAEGENPYDFEGFPGAFLHGFEGEGNDMGRPTLLDLLNTDDLVSDEDFENESGTEGHGKDDIRRKLQQLQQLARLKRMLTNRTPTEQQSSEDEMQFMTKMAKMVKRGGKTSQIHSQTTETEDYSSEDDDGTSDDDNNVPIRSAAKNLLLLAAAMGEIGQSITAALPKSTTSATLLTKTTDYLSDDDLFDPNDLDNKNQEQDTDGLWQIDTDLQKKTQYDKQKDRQLLFNYRLNSKEQHGLKVDNALAIYSDKKMDKNDQGDNFVKNDQTNVKKIAIGENNQKNTTFPLLASKRSLTTMLDTTTNISPKSKQSGVNAQTNTIDQDNSDREHEAYQDSFQSTNKPDHFIPKFFIGDDHDDNDIVQADSTTPYYSRQQPSKKQRLPSLHSPRTSNLTLSPKDQPKDLKTAKTTQKFNCSHTPQLPLDFTPQSTHLPREHYYNPSLSLFFEQGLANFFSPSTILLFSLLTAPRPFQAGQSTYSLPNTPPTSYQSSPISSSPSTNPTLLPHQTFTNSYINSDWYGGLNFTSTALISVLNSMYGPDGLPWLAALDRSAQTPITDHRDDQISSIISALGNSGGGNLSNISSAIIQNVEIHKKKKSSISSILFAPHRRTKMISYNRNNTILNNGTYTNNINTDTSLYNSNTRSNSTNIGHTMDNMGNKLSNSGISGGFPSEISSFVAIGHQRAQFDPSSQRHYQEQTFGPPSQHYHVPYLSLMSELFLEDGPDANSIYNTAILSSQIVQRLDQTCPTNDTCNYSILNSTNHIDNTATNIDINTNHSSNDNYVNKMNIKDINSLQNNNINNNLSQPNFLHTSSMQPVSQPSHSSIFTHFHPVELYNAIMLISNLYNQQQQHQHLYSSTANALLLTETSKNLLLPHEISLATRSGTIYPSNSSLYPETNSFFAKKQSPHSVMPIYSSTTPTSPQQDESIIIDSYTRQNRIKTRILSDNRQQVVSTSFSLLSWFTSTFHNEISTAAMSVHQNYYSNMIAATPMPILTRRVANQQYSPNSSNFFNFSNGSNFASNSHNFSNSLNSSNVFHFSNPANNSLFLPVRFARYIKTSRILAIRRLQNKSHESRQRALLQSEKDWEKHFLSHLTSVWGISLVHSDIALSLLDSSMNTDMVMLGEPGYKVVDTNELWIDLAPKLVRFLNTVQTDTNVHASSNASTQTALSNSVANNNNVNLLPQHTMAPLQITSISHSQTTPSQDPNVYMDTEDEFNRYDINEKFRMQGLSHQSHLHQQPHFQSKRLSRIHFQTMLSSFSNLHSRSRMSNQLQSDQGSSLVHRLPSRGFHDRLSQEIGVMVDTSERLENTNGNNDKNNEKRPKDLLNSVTLSPFTTLSKQYPQTDVSTPNQLPSTTRPYTRYQSRMEHQNEQKAKPTTQPLISTNHPHSLSSTHSVPGISTNSYSHSQSFNKQLMLMFVQDKQEHRYRETTLDVTTFFLSLVQSSYLRNITLYLHAQAQKNLSDATLLLRSNFTPFSALQLLFKQAEERISSRYSIGHINTRHGLQKPQNDQNCQQNEHIDPNVQIYKEFIRIFQNNSIHQLKAYPDDYTALVYGLHSKSDIIDNFSGGNHQIFNVINKFKHFDAHLGTGLDHRSPNTRSQTTDLYRSNLDYNTLNSNSDVIYTDLNSKQNGHTIEQNVSSAHNAHSITSPLVSPTILVNNPITRSKLLKEHLHGLNVKIEDNVMQTYSHHLVETTTSTKDIIIELYSSHVYNQIDAKQLKIGQIDTCREMDTPTPQLTESTELSRLEAQISRANLALGRNWKEVLGSRTNHANLNTNLPSKVENTLEPASLATTFTSFSTIERAVSAINANIVKDQSETHNSSSTTTTSSSSFQSTFSDPFKSSNYFVQQKLLLESHLTLQLVHNSKTFQDLVTLPHIPSHFLTPAPCSQDEHDKVDQKAQTIVKHSRKSTVDPSIDKSMHKYPPQTAADLFDAIACPIISSQCHENIRLWTGTQQLRLRTQIKALQQLFQQVYWSLSSSIQLQHGLLHPSPPKKVPFSVFQRVQAKHQKQMEYFRQQEQQEQQQQQQKDKLTLLKKEKNVIPSLNSTDSFDTVYKRNLNDETCTNRVLSTVSKQVSPQILIEFISDTNLPPHWLLKYLNPTQYHCFSDIAQLNSYTDAINLLQGVDTAHLSHQLAPFLPHIPFLSSPTTHPSLSTDSTPSIFGNESTNSNAVQFDMNFAQLDINSGSQPNSSSSYHHSSQPYSLSSYNPSLEPSQNTHRAELSPEVSHASSFIDLTNVALNLVDALPTQHYGIFIHKPHLSELKHQTKLLAANHHQFAQRRFDYSSLQQHHGVEQPNIAPSIYTNQDDTNFEHHAQISHSFQNDQNVHTDSSSNMNPSNIILPYSNPLSGYYASPEEDLFNDTINTTQTLVAMLTFALKLINFNIDYVMNYCDYLIYVQSLSQQHVQFESQAQLEEQEKLEQERQIQPKEQEQHQMMLDGSIQQQNGSLNGQTIYYNDEMDQSRPFSHFSSQQDEIDQNDPNFNSYQSHYNHQSHQNAPNFQNNDNEMESDDIFQRTHLDSISMSSTLNSTGNQSHILLSKSTQNENNEQNEQKQHSNAKEKAPNNFSHFSFFDLLQTHSIFTNFPTYVDLLCPAPIPTSSSTFPSSKNAINRAELASSLLDQQFKWLNALDAVSSTSNSIISQYSHLFDGLPFTLAPYTISFTHTISTTPLNTYKSYQSYPTNNNNTKNTQHTKNGNSKTNDTTNNNKTNKNDDHGDVKLDRTINIPTYSTSITPLFTHNSHAADDRVYTRQLLPLVVVLSLNGQICLSFIPISAVLHIITLILNYSTNQEQHQQPPQATEDELNPMDDSSDNVSDCEPTISNKTTATAVSTAVATRSPLSIIFNRSTLRYLGYIPDLTAQSQNSSTQATHKPQKCQKKLSGSKKGSSNDTSPQSNEILSFVSIRVDQRAHEVTNQQQHSLIPAALKCTSHDSKTFTNTSIAAASGQNTFNDDHTILDQDTHLEENTAQTKSRLKITTAGAKSVIKSTKRTKKVSNQANLENDQKENDQNDQNEKKSSKLKSKFISLNGDDFDNFDESLQDSDCEVQDDISDTHSKSLKPRSNIAKYQHIPHKFRISTQSTCYRQYGPKLFILRKYLQKSARFSTCSALSDHSDLIQSIRHPALSHSILLPSSLLRKTSPIWFRKPVGKPKKLIAKGTYIRFSIAHPHQRYTKYPPSSTQAVAVTIPPHLQPTIEMLNVNPKADANKYIGVELSTTLPEVPFMDFKNTALFAFLNANQHLLGALVDSEIISSDYIQSLALDDNDNDDFGDNDKSSISANSSKKIPKTAKIQAKSNAKSSKAVEAATLAHSDILAVVGEVCTNDKTVENVENNNENTLNKTGLEIYYDFDLSAFILHDPSTYKSSLLIPAQTQTQRSNINLHDSYETLMSAQFHAHFNRSSLPSTHTDAQLYSSTHFFTEITRNQYMYIPLQPHLTLLDSFIFATMRTVQTRLSILPTQSVIQPNDEEAHTHQSQPYPQEHVEHAISEDNTKDNDISLKNNNKKGSTRKNTQVQKKNHKTKNTTKTHTVHKPSKKPLPTQLIPLCSPFLRHDDLTNISITEFSTSITILLTAILNHIHDLNPIQLHHCFELWSRLQNKVGTGFNNNVNEAMYRNMSHLVYSRRIQYLQNKPKTESQFQGPNPLGYNSNDCSSLTNDISHSNNDTTEDYDENGSTHSSIQDLQDKVPFDATARSDFLLLSETLPYIASSPFHFNHPTHNQTGRVMSTLFASHNQTLPVFSSPQENSQSPLQFHPNTSPLANQLITSSSSWLLEANIFLFHKYHQKKSLQSQSLPLSQTKENSITNMNDLPQSQETSTTSLDLTQEDKLQHATVLFESLLHVQSFLPSHITTNSSSALTQNASSVQNQTQCQSLLCPPSQHCSCHISQAHLVLQQDFPSLTRLTEQSTNQYIKTRKQFNQVHTKLFQNFFNHIQPNSETSNDALHTVCIQSIWTRNIITPFLTPTSKFTPQPTQSIPARFEAYTQQTGTSTPSGSPLETITNALSQFAKQNPKMNATWNAFNCSFSTHLQNAASSPSTLLMPFKPLPVDINLSYISPTALFTNPQLILPVQINPFVSNSTSDLEFTLSTQYDSFDISSIKSNLCSHASLTIIGRKPLSVPPTHHHVLAQHILSPLFVEDLSFIHRYKYELELLSFSQHLVQPLVETYLPVANLDAVHRSNFFYNATSENDPTDQIDELTLQSLDNATISLPNYINTAQLTLVHSLLLCTTQQLQQFSLLDSAVLESVLLAIVPHHDVSMTTPDNLTEKNNDNLDILRPNSDNGFLNDSDNESDLFSENDISDALHPISTQFAKFSKSNTSTSKEKILTNKLANSQNSFAFQKHDNIAQSELLLHIISVLRNAYTIYPYSYTPTSYSPNVQKNKFQMGSTLDKKPQIPRYTQDIAQVQLKAQFQWLSYVFESTTPYKSEYYRLLLSRYKPQITANRAFFTRFDYIEALFYNILVLQHDATIAPFFNALDYSLLSDFFFSNINHIDNRIDTEIENNMMVIKNDSKLAKIDSNSKFGKLNSSKISQNVYSLTTSTRDLMDMSLNNHVYFLFDSMVSFDAFSSSTYITPSPYFNTMSNEWENIQLKNSNNTLTWLFATPAEHRYIHHIMNSRGYAFFSTQLPKSSQLIENAAKINAQCQKHAKIDSLYENNPIGSYFPLHLDSSIIPGQRTLANYSAEHHVPQSMLNLNFASSHLNPLQPLQVSSPPPPHLPLQLSSQLPSHFYPIIPSITYRMHKPSFFTLSSEIFASNPFYHASLNIASLNTIATDQMTRFPRSLGHLHILYSYATNSIAKLPLPDFTHKTIIPPLQQPYSYSELPHKLPTNSILGAKSPFSPQPQPHSQRTRGMVLPTVMKNQKIQSIGMSHVNLNPNSSSHGNFSHFSSTTTIPVIGSPLKSPFHPAATYQPRTRFTTEFDAINGTLTNNVQPVNNPVPLSHSRLKAFNSVSFAELSLSGPGGSAPHHQQQHQQQQQQQQQQSLQQPQQYHGNLRPLKLESTLSLFEGIPHSNSKSTTQFAQPAQLQQQSLSHIHKHTQTEPSHSKTAQNAPQTTQNTPQHTQNDQWKSLNHLYLLDFSQSLMKQSKSLSHLSDLFYYTTSSAALFSTNYTITYVIKSQPPVHSPKSAFSRKMDTMNSDTSEVSDSFNQNGSQSSSWRNSSQNNDLDLSFSIQPQSPKVIISFLYSPLLALNTLAAVHNTPNLNINSQNLNVSSRSSGKRQPFVPFLTQLQQQIVCNVGYQYQQNPTTCSSLFSCSSYLSLFGPFSTNSSQHYVQEWRNLYAFITAFDIPETFFQILFSRCQTHVEEPPLADFSYLNPANFLSSSSSSILDQDQLGQSTQQPGYKNSKNEKCEKKYDSSFTTRIARRIIPNESISSLSFSGSVGLMTNQLASTTSTTTTGTAGATRSPTIIPPSDSSFNIISSAITSNNKLNVLFTNQILLTSIQNSTLLSLLLPLPNIMANHFSIPTLYILATPLILYTRLLTQLSIPFKTWPFLFYFISLPYQLQFILLSQLVVTKSSQLHPNGLDMLQIEEFLIFMYSLFLQIASNHHNISLHIFLTPPLVLNPSLPSVRPQLTSTSSNSSSQSSLQTSSQNFLSLAETLPLIAHSSSTQHSSLSYQQPQSQSSFHDLEKKITTSHPLSSTSFRGLSGSHSDSHQQPLSTISSSTQFNTILTAYNSYTNFFYTFLINSITHIMIQFHMFSSLHNNPYQYRIGNLKYNPNYSLLEKTIILLLRFYCAPTYSPPLINYDSTRLTSPWLFSDCVEYGADAYTIFKTVSVMQPRHQHYYSSYTSQNPPVPTTFPSNLSPLIPQDKVIETFDKNVHTFAHLNKFIMQLYTTNKTTGLTIEQTLHRYPQLYTLFYQILNPKWSYFRNIATVTAIQHRNNKLICKVPLTAMNYLYYNNSVELFPFLQYNYTNNSLQSPHPKHVVNFSSMDISHHGPAHIVDNEEPSISTTDQSTTTLSTTTSAYKTTRSLRNQHQHQTNQDTSSSLSSHRKKSSTNWTLDHIVDQLSDLSSLSDLHASLQTELGIIFDTFLIDKPLISTYEPISLPKSNNNIDIDGFDDPTDLDNEEFELASSGSDDNDDNYIESTDSNDDDDGDGDDESDIGSINGQFKGFKAKSSANNQLKTVYNHVTQSYVKLNQHSPTSFSQLHQGIHLNSASTTIDNDNGLNGGNGGNQSWIDMDVAALVDSFNQSADINFTQPTYQDNEQSLHQHDMDSMLQTPTTDQYQQYNEDHIHHHHLQQYQFTTPTVSLQYSPQDQQQLQHNQHHQHQLRTTFTPSRFMIQPQTQQVQQHPPQYQNDQQDLHHQHFQQHQQHPQQHQQHRQIHQNQTQNDTNRQRSQPTTHMTTQSNFHHTTHNLYTNNSNTSSRNYLPPSQQFRLSPSQTLSQQQPQQQQHQHNIFHNTNSITVHRRNRQSQSNVFLSPPPIDNQQSPSNIKYTFHG